MGRNRSSHSNRSNFAYVIKQIINSKQFVLIETKVGIIIKYKNLMVENNNDKNKTKINIDKNNYQYTIHIDSKHLHDLRRWLKNNFDFILDIKK